MTSNLPIVKASKLLHINSKDFNNSSLIDVVLDQPIRPQQNENVFCSLVSGIFPVSYHLINNTNNSFVLTFSSGGNTRNVTYILQNGNYTRTDFVTSVKDLLNNTIDTVVNPSSSNLFDFTYSTRTGRTTLTYTNGTVTLIGITFLNSNLWRILNVPQTGISAVSNIITSGYLDLRYIKFIKIVINASTQEVYNTSTRTNQTIVSSVLVNSSPGTVIYHYPHYRNSVQLNDRVIDKLKIEVLDDNNNLVDFNGLDFYIQLRFDFRKTK